MTQVIYLADDEKNIRDLLVPFLERDGFSVKAFETGDALLTAYRIQRPDLVILDVMMPGTDGLTILTEIRQNDKDLPIILLTARDSDADFITAFMLGTDDYFTKPFSPIKLSLHVKALLKRRQKEAEVSQSKTYKDLCLDSVARRAQLAGQELLLTKTEFDLLEVLMENAGMAYSRDELLDRVWGFEDIESRAVDDTVKRLRKKWQAYPSQVGIETVWGYGFRLGVCR
ncbi:response regulator transcription factor [Streptococcus dysgalactiae]|uniref:DNA-binding response regulator n=1 Tax=Streptococcus dysgalactiae subsp. equisimilis TaxID=119602 RepID=A0A9X8T1Q5_STREQ|nr:response regulator transcription factor [Streptococcus dysgalactiae]SQF67711.1 DNA-binding response regulator [Streptococcus dysgalactiae subsp. equisimilis]VEF05490.1 DNA-binding response regulator [Streptococcus dysgalactiae subsp. equisimilis]